jgi:2-hydroxy-3-oxopropionate reductase
MNKKVAFIGLGNMGRPMAQRLLQADLELMVYDIDQKALQAMVDLGAQGASCIHELAGACDRILLSLPGSVDVEKVTLGEEGIIEAAKPGTVVIDTTTANPLSTRRLAAALATKGIEMMDSPVDGGIMDCESGTLSMMVGGKKELFEDCRPLLAIIAPKSLN